MKISLPLHHVCDYRNTNRKTRFVEVCPIVSLCTIRAIRDDKFTIKAYHGGSVPNSYRYAAVTDGAVCISHVSHGTNTLHTCIWLDELPANKVTLRGVGELFGYGDLFDNRITNPTRLAIVKEDAYRHFKESMGESHYLRIEFEPMELQILQDKSLQWVDRKKILRDYLNESGKMTDELSLFIQRYL
jgi:hypothetical protein